jgi:hypothetical protein
MVARLGGGRTRISRSPDQEHEPESEAFHIPPAAVQSEALSMPLGRLGRLAMLAGLGALAPLDSLGPLAALGSLGSLGALGALGALAALAGLPALAPLAPLLADCAWAIESVVREGAT